MGGIEQRVRLNNDVELPRLGLGVFQAEHGEETRNAVLAALRVGYRHVDTARIYGNEDDVGAAIRESGVPREEVFVTSKLWSSDQGYDSALHAFDKSLAQLGFEYLDLYLLHWPVPKKRLESWRALERLLEDGRVRAIGVSNFMPHHLNELLAAVDVVPAVNQIEVTPFLQQRDVRELCEQKGIAVEAYSPLAKGARMRHPVVSKIAKSLDRTSAQVLLRWGLQHGLVVLPKSIHAARIAENSAIFDFEIPADMMDELDGLEEGLITGWDPRTER